MSLRIALVILRADAARGGAERYTIDLAATLARHGHDVSLLASSFAHLPDGVKAVPLAAHGLTRPGRYRRFLKSFEQAVGPQSRFEVVHAMLPVPRCDFYHPHAGIAAEAAAGDFRHRLNRRRVDFAAVEKKLLQSPRPPVVLALSDVVGRVVEKWYPDLPVDRRMKLFNGVDTEKFRPAVDDPERLSTRSRFGLPVDKLLALIVAQDFVRKGLGPAIEALATSPDDVQLVVAGRDDPAPFKSVAAAAKVSGRVHWVGPTDDPASLYRAVDFFVLPTRHDPCSLVVLEALASGLPVITTAANGASEIMRSGQHGIILPTTTADAVADAYSILAGNAVRRAMSDRCLELRPELSWTSHVDRLLTSYRAVQAGYRS